MDATDVMRMMREAELRLAFAAATGPDDSQWARFLRLLSGPSPMPGSQRKAE